MLGDATVFAMIAVKDIEKVKDFYEGTLGLKKLDENEGGIMYGTGAGRVFVYPTPNAGTAKSTLATWEVDDLKQTTDELQAKGVEFEQYDFPDAEHDGVIHIMWGMQAAWFKDPDGNILGLMPKSY